ncbi:ATP-binding protein [Pelagibacterales bacterium]|nr:ATP-binding protein [Pelagibacterales bacterium]
MVSDPRSILSGLLEYQYSVESAFADLVDNSITAGSKNIWLDFIIDDDAPNYCITMLDDGKGMSSAELHEALKLGTRNENRSADDFGKFGFGLKCATLKYAKDITVITKNGHELSTGRLKYDHIMKTNQWEILTKSENLEKRILKKFNDLNHGTIIILDDLKKNINPNRDNETKIAIKNAHIPFFDNGIKTKKYLGLIFHRFIEKEKLKIFYNDTQEQHSWSPNPVSIGSELLLPNESIPMGNDKFIKIEFYLNPSRNSLNENYENYINSGYFEVYEESQGIFIYRNDRIISINKWSPYQQSRQWKNTRNLNRLRVIIDFDKSLDELIGIEPTKSRISLPQVTENRIKVLIELAKTKAARIRI